MLIPDKPFTRLLLPLFLLLSLPTPSQASPKVVTITSPPSIPSTVPDFTHHNLFTSAILNSTNFFRTEHNAPSLTYNTTLERFAQHYLDTSDSPPCRFAHSGGPYGENLAIGYPNVTASVEAWGNEREEYNYKKPAFSEKTGHFTQLVWRNTTAVGCGRRLCGTRGWFLACEYWPRGNVVGEFGEQVGRQVNGTGSAAAGGARPVGGAVWCAVVVGAAVMGVRW